MIDMPSAAALQGSPGGTRRSGRVRKVASAAEIDAYVGSRLRARRTETGLSQGELGRHLGLTFSQVQKYEKGSNRIGAGRLYHLAARLNVSVEYFFEGLDETLVEQKSKSETLSAEEAAKFQNVLLRISDPHARQALLSLASAMVRGND